MRPLAGIMNTGARKTKHDAEKSTSFGCDADRMPGWSSCTEFLTTSESELEKANLAVLNRGRTAAIPVLFFV